MRKGLATVFVLLAVAMPAMAGFSSGSLVTEINNATGTHWDINNTGYNLFEPTSPYNPAGPGAGVWDNNNMSPVDYPSVSPIYVPSPGQSGSYEFAEHTDIEGLLYSYEESTGSLQVWVTTSIGPDGFMYNSFPYHLGDVFVNIDDGSAYEFALLSFGTKPGLAANHNVNGDAINPPWTSSNSRDAGQLAVLDGNSILYGINGPNSWSGSATIRALVNPWAVNNPTASGGSSLVYQEISGLAVNERDFAAGPGINYWPTGTHSTFIYFWDVTVPEYLRTGLSWDEFDFHVTVQCGNDVLNGATPTEPGGGHPVPAPGAVILGLVGAAMAILRRKVA